MRAGLAARWGVLVAAIVVTAVGLGRAGVPSSVLLAALVCGVAAALGTRGRLSPPAGAITWAQAIVGVTIGVDLQRSTLHVVAGSWAPILLVCLGTLALSVAAGLILSRIAAIDQATASFGMIAGGASGIISISHELGADERIVAVLQYLRVMIIVSVTPLVAATVFGLAAPAHAAPLAQHGGLLGGLVTLAVCTAVGLPLAGAVRLPAPALLGPLLVSGAAGLSGIGWVTTVPHSIQNLAFAVIGVQVGLRFTLSSLRRIGAILPLALLLVVSMIALCAALGVVLASLAHVSQLDGYLATTPGGLSAVLALSVQTDTNSTFIVSVQLLRTFIMLLAAPPLARWIANTYVPVV